MKSLRCLRGTEAADLAAAEVEECTKLIASARTDHLAEVLRSLTDHRNEKIAAKISKKWWILGGEDGAVERNRTSDPVLTKDVLYP